MKIYDKIFAIAFSWICLLAAGPLKAQTPVHETAQRHSPPQFLSETWNLEKGLPVNNINQLYQSPDGYLWMASYSGLIRFDGVQFKIFDVGNSPGLPSNRIERIQPGIGNTFWITTEHRQLVEVDNGNFTLFSEDIGGFNTVFVDGDSVIWITDKGYLYQLKEKKPELFHPANFPHLQLGAVGRSRDGSLLLGNHPGKIIRTKYPYSQFEVLDTEEDRALEIILEDSKGRVWSATNNLTMHYGNSSANCGQDDEIKKFWSGIPPFFYNVKEDNQGNIWAVSESGIFQVDQQKIIPIGDQLPTGNPTMAARVGNSMSKCNDGNIWKVFDRKVYKNGRFQFFINEPANTILCDQEQNIWLTLGMGGIKKYRASEMKTYIHPETSNSYYGVYEDKQGKFWFGEWDNHINYLEREGEIKNFVKPKKWGNNGSFLEASDGSFYIGYMRCPPENRTLDGGCLEFEQIDGIGGTVFAILESRNGIVWFGTSNGLFQYQQGKISRVEPIGMPIEKPVRFLLESVDGSIWVATNGDGIRNFNQETGEWLAFNNSNGLTSNFIRALMEDENRNIWIATEDKGLNRLDPISGKLRYVGSENGLFDNGLHSLQMDDFGRLWMHTNKGIFWVDFSELKDFMDQKISRINSVFYTEKDGMVNREGNGGFQNSSLKSRDGRLWFCTQEGVVSIQPKDLAGNITPKTVIIDRVSTAGEDITVDRESIQFKPNQSSFTIEFTSPSFINPDRIRYRYKLEGFDKEWIESGTRKEAMYTNVPGGEYQFKVAAYREGDFRNESVTLLGIVKLPMYFETWWFRLFGIFTVGLMGLGGYKGRTRQLKRRQKELEKLVEKRTRDLEEEKVLTEVQKEKLLILDREKTRFFTNISHEFRTPLTLILGPLEGLKQGKFGGSLSKDAQDQVSIVLKNSRRLLRLVEQLLDISKLEAGLFKLSMASNKTNEYIRDIASSFYGIAERKGIDFEISIPKEPITICFDPEHFDKILSNLLSNAFKFTPIGGKIKILLSLNGNSAEITVQDTGMGIAPEHLPHLFDRFYQINKSELQPGTGIGLSLVKELTNLHGGQIKVLSIPGSGSQFILNFPLAINDKVLEKEELLDLGRNQEGSFPDNPSYESIGGSKQMALQEAKEDKEDRTTVLIVDDNRDIRNYLKATLKENFRVKEAVSGNDAMKKIRGSLPDIIVSDVMMTDGDGLTLLKEIRENPEFAFLPVILLTAKAEIADKLEGLHIGADDYILKPFDILELRARIINLLEQQKRLKNHFLLTDGFENQFHLPEIAADSRDRVFLESLKAMLIEGLSDEHLSIEIMAEKMNQSRSNLYRKVIALTGESPSNLLKRLRLERSLQLFNANAGSVSEVAYCCGFNSVSHFSKVFREKYGKPPSYFSFSGNGN